MDITPTTQQPISDDQELAKVLAGVDQQTSETGTEAPIETTLPPVAPGPMPTAQPVVEPESEATPAPIPAPMAPIGGLDNVKQAAIEELRPLIDKLNVSPEEKFDTYLLLIRSTDDKSLIEPAHETAKLISDETKRAQALLDVIKEIDYLAQR
ncbi:MAG: hypothetical protein WAQ22_01670 [Candidatus Saccharimonas sp.]